MIYHDRQPTIKLMNIPVKRSSMPRNRQPTNIATGKGRSKQRPKMLIKSINPPLLKGRKRFTSCP
ncbi:hypothetical protein HMPREF1621_00017 [Escherichia coli A25922R]|nr:hypothetical protein HMPREF1593_00160 [Escherichia coli 907391]ESE38810.1 hypothetical protein HMPREF1621_00017 [Escherichia coli A25922R]